MISHSLITACDQATGARWRMFVRAAAVAVVGLLIVGQAAPAEDLTSLARDTRDKFVTISEDQLADARADLARAARDMERFVGRGKNGQRWKEYLKWGELKGAMSADGQPELRKLVVVYRQLNTNNPGLEATQFRRVSDALQSYIDLAAAAEMTGETYGSQIDALQSELGEYQANPNAPLDLSIGQRLDFVTSLGQSPELVAAIRRQFAQPNVFVNISTSLIRAAIDKPIDRQEVVPDNILGVSLRSDTHTVGEVTCKTVPCEDCAVLELTSTGHIESKNRGTKGPAAIRSSSETDYTATKRIEFSNDAFDAQPAMVDAKLKSDIHSISKQGGGFGNRFVSRVGWKKAGESKGRANSIATDHTKERVRNRMDDEAGESITKARQRYDDEYRTPLIRVGGMPEHVRFSSTAENLALEIAQAGRGQLAAHEPPPALPAKYDAAIRIHQSAVNNYAALVLGGATAAESKPGEKAELDVALPGWMDKVLEDREDERSDATDADGEPFKPWSITLRRNRPLTVAFADGKVTLTIHLARLTSGEEDFTRWDVTGIFTPELKDGGVVLHREGDLEVLPTDFNPAKDQLSSRQVALRSNLTKVLNERSAQGRGFSKTIEIHEWQPTGKFEDVGPLALETFNSGGGWLTLAWDRP